MPGHPVTRPEGERVLRRVHSSHRTERQVRAELHWLGFLAEGGVSVLAVYREVRALGDADLALVPTLLGLREVDLSLLTQRKWDLTRLPEAQERRLATSRRNILEGRALPGVSGGGDGGARPLTPYRSCSRIVGS